MAEIGVRELRAQLAAALRRAQAGERLIVTVDGHPVAQLGAPQSDSFGVSVTDLLARGLVIAPRRRGDFSASTPITLYSGVRIDRSVNEIRS